MNTCSDVKRRRMLDQMPLYKGWGGGGGAVSDQQHNINQSVSQHGL